VVVKRRQTRSRPQNLVGRGFLRLWSRPAGWILAAALFGVFAAGGCASTGGAAGPRVASIEADAEEQYDFGQDWDRSTSPARQQRQATNARASSTGPIPAGPAGSRSPAAPSEARGEAAAPADAPDRDPTDPFWTVVLATFTGEAHELRAAEARQRIILAASQLASARVRTTERGSMVSIGRFADPASPEARAELERVKSLRIQSGAPAGAGTPGASGASPGPRGGGAPLFPAAMLGRVTPPVAPAALHPHSLMAARELHPGVNPLYSLQVAVWSDFESGRLSMDELRQRAEAEVRQLRARGFEAYFHHDPDRRMSMVTVGLFDRRAVDPRSGMYSDEVDRLLKQFPAHLVNGEVFNEPLDPRRPSRGTRVQTPKLVEVPR
jgi:hypothetical protein